MNMDFVKKVIVPVAAAAFLAALFYPLCSEGSVCDYRKLWLLVGIPFGIHRMYFWMLPKNFDVGGTVGLFVLNLLAGGIIGGVVLSWKLLYAAGYLLCAAGNCFTGILKKGGKDR